MEKTVLVRVSYLVKLDENEIYNDNDDSILDQLNDKLLRNRYFSIGEKKIKMESDMVSTIILDDEKMNCCKCSECKSWVTDVDKVDEIDGLCPGAVIDGRLYCAECLDALFGIKKSHGSHRF